MFRFIEAPVFTDQIGALMTDDEYAELQRALAEHPTAGYVIPGLHGLRKIRWRAKGRGKRGGARVIYLLLAAPEVIFLLFAFAKGDMTDLTPDQRARLRRAVDEIKAEFEK
jgi:hypothetical protein